MSRIGNRHLAIPTGVNVTINPTNVVISNDKKQTLTVNYTKAITVKNENNTLIVTRANDEKLVKSEHGTVNANLSNALIGLSQGFTVSLELKGVGYKAKVEGNNLNLALGFSHPVIIAIPSGVTLDLPSQTEINIKGFDKQVVGQFAADIRKWRKPEPYKGKGVLYKGEHIIRKVGKTADKKK